MLWPFNNRPLASYWLKVFAWYALTEACIQLLFLYILNNFGTRTISNWEFHLIMWVFQCVLIWPIWWMAYIVSKKSIATQILVAVGFYLLYSYVWFGPVQKAVAYLHMGLQHYTRTPETTVNSYVDRANNYTYINYQLLKHSFRLSWFFLANYFYHYRLEEKKRLELAVSNKDLQLRLLKWHLNPQFYFKTIDHLRTVAAAQPSNCTGPILQLAKVMEYVIYEAKEKMIDVKKEIHFLQNYINLLSSQSGSAASFELAIRGDFDKLRIAPLLLAAFIDKISAQHEKAERKYYHLQLDFSGAEMQFEVNDASAQTSTLPGLFADDDPSMIRLRELYPGKYSFDRSMAGKPFRLKLKLDAQD